MSLIDITAPAVEPVTSAEIKANARIDDTAFDTMIAILIPSLRRQAEARMGRRLITQTVELVIDAFPDAEIDLSLPNVQSIDSVKYIDTAGVQQTLSGTAYSLDSDSMTCWLVPAYGTTWPDTLYSANAVRVRFVVGYGDAGSDVPDDVRHWIIAHVSQALRAPENLVPGTVKTLPYLDGLLDPHRIWRIA